jgi:hypothetical protein
MHVARVAIDRWGWLAASLIALTAATELREIPPAPAVAPAATASTVAFTATASNAPGYAILDHVPLRRVTLGDREVGVATAHAPAVTIRAERPYYFGHEVGGPPVLPSWVESHHGDQPVTTFHRELDGSWIAIADNTVILIDRDHRAQLGLDFDWFRMFAPPHHPESEHARVTIVEAHRVGSRVIAYGTDPEGGPFLASIDIATGASAWVVQLHTDSIPNFAVTSRYAVISGFGSANPELVVRELATGSIVATAPTKEGEYTLDTRADGSLHGVIEALAQDGYTSEIDVAIE